MKDDLNLRFASDSDNISQPRALKYLRAGPSIALLVPTVSRRIVCGIFLRYLKLSYDAILIHFDFFREHVWNKLVVF